MAKRKKSWKDIIEQRNRLMHAVDESANGNYNEQWYKRKSSIIDKAGKMLTNIRKSKSFKKENPDFENPTKLVKATEKSLNKKYSYNSRMGINAG